MYLRYREVGHRTSISLIASRNGQRNAVLATQESLPDRPSRTKVLACWLSTVEGLDQLQGDERSTKAQRAHLITEIATRVPVPQQGGLSGVGAGVAPPFACGGLERSGMFRP